MVIFSLVQGCVDNDFPLLWLNANDTVRNFSKNIRRQSKCSAAGALSRHLLRTSEGKIKFLLQTCAKLFDSTLGFPGEGPQTERSHRWRTAIDTVAGQGLDSSSASGVLRMS